MNSQIFNKILMSIKTINKEMVNYCLSGNTKMILMEIFKMKENSNLINVLKLRNKRFQMK